MKQIQVTKESEQFVLFDKSLYDGLSPKNDSGKNFEYMQTMDDMSKILPEDSVTFIDDEEQMELFE